MNYNEELDRISEVYKRHGYFLLDKNERYIYAKDAPLNQEIIDFLSQYFDAAKYDHNFIEFVVRVLKDKRAIRKVDNNKLLDLFESIEGDGSLKWSIGHVFMTIIHKNNVDRVISILRDKSHGIARQQLLMSLRKFKHNPKVGELLVELFDDPTVMGMVINVLRKIPRLEVKEKLLEIKHTHKNKTFRIMAKEALDKLPQRPTTV